MSILTQARTFVESLLSLADQRPGRWRRCPYCGSTDTVRHGSYTKHPITLHGPVEVTVPRHRCRQCRRTYSEQSPDGVPRSWYSREVHRRGVDLWVHLRTSYRRAAEWLRSEIGHQERFLFWKGAHSPVEVRPRCTLCASTLCRWRHRAGEVAQASTQGHLAGVPCSGKMGVDGLWAHLRGGVKRVMLLLTDSVTGIIYPIVVGPGEGREDWERLFVRAARAGLDLLGMDGLTSDGSAGLRSWMQMHLPGVYLQRCVWHVWRSLGCCFRGLGEAAKEALKQRVHAVLDAQSYEQAEVALAKLRAQGESGGAGRVLEEVLEEVLVYQQRGQEGLIRVGPEWHWRDFRLRLSRGRNHGSALRLEQAGLVWGIAHNFTPAQERSERKRHYKHPGLSPLEVAGSAPGALSYLDALHV